MHVANIFLYNSYIPQKFRKMIQDFYGYSDTNKTLKTSSINNFNSDSELDSGATRYDLQFNYLINDDIQLGLQSSFGSITNLAGMEMLGDTFNLVRIGGSMIKKPDSQQNIQNLNNLFSYSIWQKTEPLTLNLSILLYAKTDPLIDVVIPAYTLMSHCIIDYAKEDGVKMKKDNIYGFPGLSAFEAIRIGNVDEKLNKVNENDTSTNINDPFYSKLISVYISGLVNMKLAMIKNVTPTFSKHTAKSSYSSKSNIDGVSISTMNTFNGNYPIYAELNLQIESITPADSNMLWEGTISSMRDRHLGKNSSNDSALNDITTQNSSS